VIARPGPLNREKVVRMSRKKLTIVAPKIQAQNPNPPSVNPQNPVKLDLIVPRLCRFCRNWHRQNIISGLCRARPPFVNPSTGESRWPTCNEDDWCGDFKRLPEGMLEGGVK